MKEADFTKETPATLEANDKLNIQHQQKLIEVENFLTKENGQWKCKTCQKIFRKKDQFRRHAENHVSGLSFSCPHCSERFPTQSRRSSHKQDKHRDVIVEDQAAKNRYVDLDHEIR